jgi:hypothetical protein
LHGTALFAGTFAFLHLTKSSVKDLLRAKTNYFCQLQPASSLFKLLLIAWLLL